jgi:hypothetical protein
MINLVYNDEVIAMPRREQATATTLGVDPYQMFGTEYGMFIPVGLTGYQFIRWVRKGMVDTLPKKSVMNYMLHVSNDGEVMVIVADTEADTISCVPYYGKQFLRMHQFREVAEAYNSIIENCTTISEAVRMVDEGCPDGLYDPIIFFVSDWVKYAKEKGYTKTFYHSSFTN